MAMGKTLTIYLAADLKKFNTGMGQAQTGLAGFTSSLKNMMGPALLGAAAAVGALATKMAVDGVKAAIDDEKAQASLAKTLENVGLAHDVQPIEDYISTLERSLGVADDELRPAYDRLIRSTKDTGQANKLLSLALDVSAGTGKSLSAVVEALGKAYDGNTAGLSRLGAGIDSAILKSGNMDVITQTLSNTFAGQATVAAGEFEGQMRVLNVAVDNLAEAFGRGLIKSFDSAMKQSGDMAKKLAEMEDEAEAAGATLGAVALSALDVGTNLLGAWTNVITFNRGLQESNNIFAKALGWLNPLNVVSLVLGDNLQAAGEGADEAAGALEDTNAAAQTAAGGFSNLTYHIGMSTKAYADYVRANAVGRSIIQNANLDYKDLAARLRDVDTYESIAIDTTTQYTGARGASTAATNKQAKAEQALTDIFQAQKKTVTDLASVLESERGKLEAAVTAMNEYAATMQSNILSGLDLGSAYTNQFDEAGKMTGEGVLQGFQKMVDQADWFGNVLVALKAQKVDDSLIQYIASQGPEVGGALGQQMLGDKGLLSSLNEKWVAVQERTKSLSMQLVPEFMVAGVESGIEMVNGLADQLGNETQRLGRIGAAIAKPVGARFKAQLLEDIASAIREAQAFQSAARAEAAAAAASRAVPITEQSAAQALSNLLRNADQRNGQNIAPVLA